MAPPTTDTDPADLRAIRGRWRRLERAAETPLLRVTILASYTADPLVPYLGTTLSDAGLPPALQTGPYNQIIQECLGPQGGTGAFVPDVVVVAQRLEELPRQAWETGLLQVAEAALQAAERWRATLIAVLPGIPDAFPDGVGDDGVTAGWFASATAARERLRATLAGRPNVHLVDLEAVLRSVGSDRAYHPALFKHAKIPYRDEVFHLLGRRIARVIRLRFGESCRAAAIAVHDPADAESLEPLLRWLRSAEVIIGILGREDLVRRELTAADQSSAGLVDDWIFGGGAVSDQAAELARRNGLAPSDLAMLHWEDGVLTLDARDAFGRPRPPISLGKDPERWPAGLAATAVFDRFPSPAVLERLPAAEMSEPSPEAVTGRARRPGGLSLEEFVAGLGTEVDFRTATADDIDKVADMLLRTKDFTLGTPFTEDDAMAALKDEDRKLLLGTVRDRFGDLGTSVTIALRRAGQDCLAEAFLVSCPAMGKGVEKIAVQEITAAARQLGANRIVLPYRSTDRNKVAIDFLKTLPAGDVPGDLAIVVPAEPDRTPE